MASRQLDLIAGGAKPRSKGAGGGGGRKRGGDGGGGDGSDEPPSPADASLVFEAQRRYLNYAVSVITSRALPDVRDGLKPVQRRILYAMYANLHLYPDAKFRKSATIVGDVLGKFHPHGDSACYEAMVRLAQPFSMRVTLVEGHGNFGSLDGDAPAAHRYTEARLAPLAMELLDEIKQGTVDFRPNYDGTTEEPIVLPAKVPQLLINGCTGIAVGMATNIPPHNLGEVCAAAVAMIDDRKLETKDLLKYIKGPDFPTGGQIINSKKELRDIYETGQGGVRVRGEWKTESGGRQRRPHRHHLDPLRADQGQRGRADRRRDHQQEAPHAGRRARRVDRRRPHRAGGEVGRRSQSGDGLPLQAHAARDRVPRQPDLPLPDGEQGGRRPAAGQPGGDAGRVHHLPRGDRPASVRVRAGRARAAHPHPRGLRDHLRHARRGHPDHPQIGRQGRRGPQAVEAVRAVGSPDRGHPRAQALQAGAPGDRRHCYRAEGEARPGQGDPRHPRRQAEADARRPHGDRGGRRALRATSAAPRSAGRAGRRPSSWPRTSSSTRRSP